MSLPPFICPLSEALGVAFGVALADEEGLAIMLLLAPIICELSIIVPSGIIC